MKKLICMLGTIAISLTMSITAFAGWEQDGDVWKYQNPDGTYLNNCWFWLDGNDDGIAECYYFGADGIMLSNTTTPDNYTVNENGALVINDTVRVVEFTEKCGTVPPTAEYPHGTTKSGRLLCGYPELDAMILEDDRTTKTVDAKPPMYDTDKAVEGLRWR